MYAIKKYFKNCYICYNELNICRFVSEIDNNVYSMRNKDYYSNIINKMRVISGGARFCIKLVEFYYSRFIIELSLAVDGNCLQFDDCCVLFLSIIDPAESMEFKYFYGSRNDLISSGFRCGFRWGFYYANDERILRHDEKKGEGIINTPVPLEFGYSLIGNMECITDVLKASVFSLDGMYYCLFDLLQRSSKVVWYGGSYAVQS